MKKTMKRTLCLALSLSAALGTLTACGGGGVDNTKVDNTNLHIYILDRGYGTEWLEKMGDAFEKYIKDTEGNTVQVHVEEATDSSVLKTSFESGDKRNDVDLYFGLETTVYQLRNNYTKYWSNYSEGLAEFTDLYETKIPGEDVTFGEKMNDSIREMVEFDENGEKRYFAIPWATGTNGLVYNADVLEDALGTYELPNTTDELYQFCEDITAATNYYPFIYAGQLNQWSGNLFVSWWAQYEGLTEFNNFFEGKVYNEDVGKYVNNSKDIFAQQGRMEALQVLEYLLSMERDGGRGWHPEDCAYQGDIQFKELQKYFLSNREKRQEYADKNYNYAMMPNGDWLEQESKSATSTNNFAMMKTPVISSIIDRLPSINDDATLSAVIDYVDGVSDVLPAGVSETDVEEVRIARNITYSKATEHLIYAPVYSNAQELAKKFLLYMASDAGLKLYKENVAGGYLPFDYDYSSMDLSKFEQSVVALQNSYFVSETNKSALFYNGGISASTVKNGGMMEALLSVKKTSEDYMSASEIFEEMKYTTAEWQQVLRNAGL